MRAFAVLAVMMFHGGIPHMDGGFMGVDAFFVLSGFLITSLLIGEWRQSLTIKLGAFWARRARRLLPALLLDAALRRLLRVGDRAQGDLRRAAARRPLHAALREQLALHPRQLELLQRDSAPSSPLLHTWSLAVEEQFYVIWPLVVLGRACTSRAASRRSSRCAVRRPSRSAHLDDVVYDGGLNTNRAYLGTDTRSQCLFIGCALAVGLVLLSQRSHEEGRLAKGELWRPQSRPAPGCAARLGVVGRRRRRRHVGAHHVDVVVPLFGRLLPHRPGGRRRHPGGGGGAAQRRATGAVAGPGALRRPHLLRPLHLALADLHVAGPRADRAVRATSSSRVRVLVTFAVSVVSFHLIERPIRMGTFVSQWRAWLVGAGRRRCRPGRRARGHHRDDRGGRHGAADRPRRRALDEHDEPSSTRRGQPVRVLLFGDSVALTLGLGLGATAEQRSTATSSRTRASSAAASSTGPRSSCMGPASTTPPACNGHAVRAQRARGEAALAEPVDQ